MKKQSLRQVINLISIFFSLFIIGVDADAACMPNILNTSLTSTTTLLSTGINDCVSNSGSIATNIGIISQGDFSTTTNSGIINTTFEGVRLIGDHSTFINSGSINNSGFAGIEDNGFTEIITNTTTGSITGGGYGILSNINQLIVNNSGLITGYQGIALSSSFDIITNYGLIAGYQYGINSIGNSNTITNIGAITASNGVGIIVKVGETNLTLNNAQGGNGLTPVTTPLTLSGYLPSSYNIIIDNSNHYGQLSVTNIGASYTNFGIYADSNITNRLYSSVLSNIIGHLNITTGTYDNMTWALVPNGSNYDLTFTGASLTKTQVSLETSAVRLRSVFNQAIATSNFANMNTYDCNVFDTNGFCISAGGRYTSLDNPSSNTTSAVLVLGYKATAHIRIGGFLDQSVNNNLPTGIQVSNKNPLMGLFAVWNQNEDGLGYQLKIANAYHDQDVTTTRDAVQTTEAGTGTANLNTQSYLAEFSYAFEDQYGTIVRPYVAFRRTTIKQDAYTETGVTTPLTYAALSDRSPTALLGIKFNHALSLQANLTASLGLEQDLDHHTEQYTATSTGIVGLTPLNFSNTIHRTRGVASLGAYYAVSKTQRISGDIYYQELPFQSTGSTSAYFSYMIGF